ncbi:MAG TPA: hypothetical protein VGN82_23475 [Bosea sp. (in: a-proteobacteria)]|jgi:hypothetical protein|uniref:hypothetical protein n=1 Tax=Bosea sp. (in: a-proteobacteria) TaxID=1871050 RepID=UPI002E15C75D|nr:hypothetical protein [Bosea sp. (in: a-proteobacteria)]
MRLIKLLSIIWLALVGLGLSGTAHSQAPRGPPCADRTQVIVQLNTFFGERAVGSGLADGGFVLELFVSRRGTWTLFATTPQGLSCFVASGQAWEPVPAPDIFARR